MRAAIASRVAAVAGVFVVVVLALLAWDHSPRLAKEPLSTDAQKAMKERLADSPSDTELKEQIRAVDVEMRREYFGRRRFTAKGGWLLLGGMAVLVIALKTASTLRRKLPAPEVLGTAKDPDPGTAQSARRGVAVVGAALALAACALAWSYSTESADWAGGSAETVAGSDGTDGGEARNGGDATAGADVPSAEEMAKNWPRFRGPGGLGISAYTDIPITWDAASGKNIVFKTAVPLPGHSSPVVWNDRIFLTGADEKNRQVFCFGTSDGKLLWRQDVPGTSASTATVPKVNEDTGFAASTAATDGRRVYAIFANGDLAAFTFDGKLAWSRSLGIPQNSYGHASSLSVWRNRLLVQLDQAAEKDRLSKLMALDVTDGKTKWETPRPSPNSWTTPIVIEVAGRPQIITAGDPWVIAYNPGDGKELWRVKCLRQDVGPSATFADGVVYAVNVYPQLTAMRPDGQGDVTKTNVLWVGEDGLPDTCSPLAIGAFVCLLSTEGTLSVYDAKSGKQQKPVDFEARFKASPSAVGKYVYLLGDAGKAFIVEPSATECKQVSQGDVGEECSASPAFAPGRMYVRGKTHLFCIGSK